MNNQIYWANRSVAAVEGFCLSLKSACFRLLLIVFGLFATQVSAASAYQCVAREFRVVTGDGRSSDDSYMERQLKQTYDKEHYRNFSVDTATGNVSGPYVFHTKGWKTTVLDRGSQEQAFKLLVLSSKGYVHVKFLQIFTYEKGERKPFLFIDGYNQVTGTCVAG